jgi:hypothetical protein
LDADDSASDDNAKVREPADDEDDDEDEEDEEDEEELLEGRVENDDMVEHTRTSDDYHDRKNEHTLMSTLTKYNREQSSKHARSTRKHTER